jgi:hypothetical protein
MYGVPQQQQQQQQKPQYAHFSPNNGVKSAEYSYNDDALPAMPSWDTSRTARSSAGNNMEMDRFNSASAPMLPKSTAHSPYEGDIGMMSGPQYHDTGYHQSMPAASYNDPYSGYSGAQQQSGTIRGGAYEPSVAAPPSYRTTPPSVMSPPVGRKPVSGSWREV